MNKVEDENQYFKTQDWKNHKLYNSLERDYENIQLSTGYVPPDKIHLWCIYTICSEEPKLIECNNFCSTKCLDEFKKNNSDKLEKYEFYEINRCSCYYDCKELNNLRYMCEKEKILNYEPGAFFCNIQPKNFCEPANASIIKASINIHKEVKNLKKETTFQFKLTAAMTILVIILTLANIWIAAQNDTATKIDELRMDLSTIYSSVNDSLDKYNIKIDETNNHLKNIDEYFQGNRNNNET